jgi:5-dehydro-4-deoxyglucarate dehydratase
VPGYAVSLVKAGVALEGTAAGPVRPPLVMPTADDLTELRTIIAAGRSVLAEALAKAV